MNVAVVRVDRTLHERPVDFLRGLLRFDTTNPPGNERACIEWLGTVLDAYGVEYGTVARDPEVEVLRYSEGPPAADMGLFDHLAGVLDEAGDGRPVPLLLSGGTDARHFADLGIRSYGFPPMPLPEGFDFTDYVHATDERIPVEAVEFGAVTVTEAVRGYGPGATDG